MPKTAALKCQVCGVRIRHAKTGRPPKFCDVHRATRGKRQDRPVALPPTRTTSWEQLARKYRKGKDPRRVLVLKPGTGLHVPDDVDMCWPTLGPEVVAYIEHHFVHGPGDLRGEPLQLDAEKKGLIWRMYELYPEGHERAGRRRFDRVCISVRKGWAKTELAALIAAAELAPGAPVRCTGWSKNGSPKWGPVRDPYVALLAFTEEQSDELAYAALKMIIEQGKLAAEFDSGLARILRKDGSGRAVSLSGAPSARDGARTTFQVFDETHRLNLPRLKHAHRTMLANIPKRFRADAWSLEITTAYAPGEESVAEGTMKYAQFVHEGRVQNKRLLFFHRQAGDNHDLTTREGVRAAVLEASGPVAAWSHIDGIVDQWEDPENDRSFLERVWLNRPTQAQGKAFDVKVWAALRRDFEPRRNARIALGFDGSRFEDSTGLVATDLETGHQWVVGCWERPAGQSGHGWEVPVAEVDAAVADAFKRFRVERMYCDPEKWESWVATWAGRHEGKVHEWWTNRRKPMAYAIRAFALAMNTGELSHDGDRRYDAHIGNAFRLHTTLVDEQDQPLWVLRKERPDSNRKIDLAVAGVLSWEARNDAIAAGALKNPGMQFFTASPREEAKR